MVGSFFSLLMLVLQTGTQTTYFPGATWQVKMQAETQMNKSLLDSAVNFALSSENKVERDLRIANLKSYANEPDYKIIGPNQRAGRFRRIDH